MAISLSQENWGVLVDYFGGRRDIRQKKLKMLHNLSFVEDPTRVFRGIRLEQRLHFTMEDNTLRLLKSCVRGGLLNLLSGLRIKSELEFILREARPYQAVRRLQELGIWENLFPGLEMELTAVVLMRRLAVFTRRLSRDLPPGDQTWIAFLAALITDNGEEFQRSVMDRLNLSPGERRLMEFCLFKRGLAENDLGGRGDRPPSDIYTYLGNIPPVAALFWAAATERKRVRRRILLYLTRWHKVEPMLSGQDVLDMGLRSGPQIGLILKKLRESRLDGKIETRDEEIEWIREHFPATN
jgi:tRNA nucleotidyltransferase (CCA-adding enzyme)